VNYSNITAENRRAIKTFTGRSRYLITSSQIFAVVNWLRIEITFTLYCIQTAKLVSKSNVRTLLKLFCNNNNNNNDVSNRVIREGFFVVVFFPETFNRVILFGFEYIFNACAFGPARIAIKNG